MIINEATLKGQLVGILDSCDFRLSTELPSVWAQSRMSMKEGNFQGKLSHDITPYWTEILDNLGPYSGYEDIALMGASQGGKTKAIIEPITCFYISEHPCNIGYISGNTELALESMIDLDKAIENAGLKHLIRPATTRLRNSRTGDTNKMKEYAGGSVTGGSATNHKTFRRRNWRLIICDDIEEANDGSAKAGSTVEIIKKRANSYGKNKKRFWCSTPLLVNGSIIYPLYLSGDQRKYNVPCQKCGTAIHLEFEIKIDEKEKAGITWKYDSNGRLKPGSVEYICQSCGKGFSEKNKYKFNKDGLWVPTAEPESETLISYYWNNLYSAPGMDNWDTIVREYISANPLGQPVNERAMQTFWNLRMGLPCEDMAISTNSKNIQRDNIRSYKIGTIPNKQSIADGNGRIVLVTLAGDCNGTVAGQNKAIFDDARIDYQIVAWSENGASYNVEHGSIGTFIPRENSLTTKEDRVKWTYQMNQPNSVWPEFDKICRRNFRDEDGLYYTITMPGIDVGHASDLIYPYIDWTIGRYPANPVVGVRGHKDQEYKMHGLNESLYNVGKARTDVYYLQVGIFKDKLSNHMLLKWSKGDETQPSDYMNFPQPEGGLYLMENFFEHFESEERKIVKDSKGNLLYRWEKKNSIVQNHQWDCYLYNMALREIIVKTLGKQLGEKEFEWPDYVAYLRG